MKTALCVYGQFRTGEFCFPSIKKNIIDVYNPDIFICSDSEEGKIRDLYHPTRLEIHPQNEISKLISPRIKKYGESFPNPGPYKNYPIWTISDLSALYKVWRCKEMLAEYEKKDGKYNLVIGTRFDAKFLNIQPITLPEPNTFYIPETDAFGHKAKNGVHWSMGYCTHIWWGDSDTAQSIMNGFHWSDDYYNETHLWAGEAMIKWYCDKMKINVKYTNVTFMLIRGDSQNPREGLPPWDLLSATKFPEYLAQPNETPEMLGRRLEWEKKLNKRKR